MAGIAPHLMPCQLSKSPRTHYQDAFGYKRKSQIEQLPLAVTSATRRNNPHPDPGFLDPHKLPRADKEARLKARVQRAVDEYLENLRGKKAVERSRIPHADNNEERPATANAAARENDVARPTSSKAASPPHQPIYKARIKDVQSVKAYIQPSLEQLKEKADKKDKEQILRFEKKVQERPKTATGQRMVSSAAEKGVKQSVRPKSSFVMVERSPTPYSQQQHWIAWPTSPPSTPGKPSNPLTQSLHKAKNHSYVEAAATKRHRTPTPPQSSNTNFRVSKRHTDNASPLKQTAMISPLPPTPSRMEEPIMAQELPLDDEYYGDNIREAISPIAEFAITPERQLNYHERPETVVNVLKEVGSAADDPRDLLLHPRLRQWMKHASHYEKEVVSNMFLTLNGGKTASMSRSQNPKQPQMRPPATATVRPTQASPVPRRASSGVPGRDGSMDAATRQLLNNLITRLNGEMKSPEPPRERPKYRQAVSTSYPHSADLKKGRGRIPRKEYVHGNSTFFKTGGHFRSHYIIFPDWVSENMGIRKLEAQAAENRKRHPPPGKFAYTRGVNSI